jgi:endonuclease YncB( thermonuclease family)
VRKKAHVTKIGTFYKRIKRWSLALCGLSALSLCSLFYYAGTLGKTDIVFRRLWNTAVYASGLSQLKQTGFGDLELHGLVSVYDGDTFTCDIDGVHPLMGERIGIRIKGIDTPEMNDQRPHVKSKAVLAKRHLQRRLLTADKIELKDLERDKYFRILAEVLVDGVSMGREMVAKGLARPYDGGTKSSW